MRLRLPQAEPGDVMRLVSITPPGARPYCRPCVEKGRHVTVARLLLITVAGPNQAPWTFTMCPTCDVARPELTP